MAGYHIVKQGEHLSSLAKENGFRDYHTIWDDPNNAELKQQRVNANVIFPGDRVFIPDKEQREESRPTTKKHSFLVRKTGLKLRLTLEDLYEKPIANAKCKLTVESQNFDLTTDGEGKLEQEIPKDAKSATLVIMDEQTPANAIELDVRIGHLDPVDKISGQKARLNNLGYFAGDFDEGDQAQQATQAGTGSGQNSKAPQTQNGSAGDGDSKPQSATKRAQTGSDADGGSQQQSENQQAQNASGGDQDSAHDSDAQQQFRSAVEEFQCDHGLTVDGICGPLTQGKLKQVHGC